ncbi:hypothetical protein [Halostreptopolyspora alba]|uniref:Uncharacterized protein n=1 Tax=Halostreptopolyspora alba TaxID=2487137 RepID=A0A3N0EDA7_9ACTN|nr:hypothetical protein EFW17_07725 [Nocardiopsaceae bacterium YIM 96095]
MIAATGLAALLVGIAGCSSGDQEQDGSAEPEPEPKTDTEIASELDQAQLVEFNETKADPEQSEQGTYAELSTTQQTAELRESTELDKPECADAVDRWAQSSEVREAPASLATYPREDGSISHTLVRLDEQAAKKAVEAAAPEECASYEATTEDGSTTTYTLKDLDLDTVGDDSRAYVLEAAAEGESIHMYNIVYHNGDRLANVSMLRAEEDPSNEETLLEFAQSAVEREEEVLS